MPPRKKATANAETETAVNGEASETKFAWTAENDRALLILCFGRNPTTDDYAKFVHVLPGASYNGVKIRCSKMRMEMKRRYEELGWEVPEISNAKTETKARNEIKDKNEAKDKARASSRKRKGSDEGADAEREDGWETLVKAKKPRAKKGKDKKKGVEEEVKDGEDGGDGKGEEGVVRKEADEGVVKEEADEEAV